MDVTITGILSLARYTLAHPREAARQVMALDLSMQDRWLALFLTAVLSTLLLYAGVALIPPPEGTPPARLASPLQMLLVQSVVMFAGVQAVWRIGRARGGVGDLPSTVSLMAWLQLVLLLVQVVQLLVAVFLPPVSLLVGLAGVVLLFWLLTHFVAELHGFRSLGATFAGIVASMTALVLLLALLFAPFLPELPEAI